MKCPVCNTRLPQILASETDVYFQSYAPGSLIDGLMLRIQPLLKVDVKIVCLGCGQEILPSKAYLSLLTHGDLRNLSGIVAGAAAVGTSKITRFHNEKCLRKWLDRTPKANG